MKKVALYMRVSTSSQSTALQERDLTIYCQQLNYTIYKQYVDHGISGTKESRPALNDLMNDARKRKFDAVIVWRFDRFARSTKHLILALEEFQQLNIGFISYSENINTDSIMGKAMFSIISSLAEFERNLIVERINAGLANAKAKGKKLGRPKKRSDHLIINLRKQGLSYRAIAKQLGISLGSVQQALKKNS